MNARLKALLRFLVVWGLLTVLCTALFMGVITFGIWLGVGSVIVPWDFCWVVAFISGVCSVEGAIPVLER